MKESTKLLLAPLSEAQKRFLEARAVTKSDRQACLMAKVSVSLPPVWKRYAPFKVAYAAVTTEKEEDEFIRDVVNISSLDRHAVISQNIDQIAARLPEILAENIRLALHANKESDRIRAMQLLYNAIGFAAESIPVNRQNKVFVQMLTLLGPQVEAEAKKRGLPVGSTISDLVKGVDTIEGEYEEEEEEIEDDS